MSQVCLGRPLLGVIPRSQSHPVGHLGCIAPPRGKQAWDEALVGAAGRSGQPRPGRVTPPTSPRATRLSHGAVNASDVGHAPATVAASAGRRQVSWPTGCSVANGDGIGRNGDRAWVTSGRIVLLVATRTLANCMVMLASTAHKAPRLAWLASELSVGELEYVRLTSIRDALGRLRHFVAHVTGRSWSLVRPSRAPRRRTPAGQTSSAGTAAGTDLRRGTLGDRERPGGEPEMGVCGRQVDRARVMDARSTPAWFNRASTRSRSDMRTT